MSGKREQREGVFSSLVKAISASLTLNVIQSVIIYILQTGQVW